MPKVHTKYKKHGWRGCVQKKKRKRKKENRKSQTMKYVQTIFVQNKLTDNNDIFRDQSQTNMVGYQQ